MGFLGNIIAEARRTVGGATAFAPPPVPAEFMPADLNTPFESGGAGWEQTPPVFGESDRSLQDAVQTPADGVFTTVSHEVQLVSERKPVGWAQDVPNSTVVGSVEQSVAPRNPSLSPDPADDGFRSAYASLYPSYGFAEFSARYQLTAPSIPAPLLVESGSTATLRAEASSTAAVEPTAGIPAADRGVQEHVPLLQPPGSGPGSAATQGIVLPPATAPTVMLPPLEREAALPAGVPNLLPTPALLPTVEHTAADLKPSTTDLTAELRHSPEYYAEPVVDLIPTAAGMTTVPPAPEMAGYPVVTPTGRRQSAASDAGLEPASLPTATASEPGVYPRAPGQAVSGHPAPVAQPVQAASAPPEPPSAAASLEPASPPPAAAPGLDVFLRAPGQAVSGHPAAPAAQPAQVANAHPGLRPTAAGITVPQAPEMTGYQAVAPMGGRRPAASGAGLEPESPSTAAVPIQTIRAVPEPAFKRGPAILRETLASARGVVPPSAAETTVQSDRTAPAKDSPAPEYTRARLPERAVPTVAAERPRSVEPPPAPAVHIGTIEIIVEAPPTEQRPREPGPVPDLTSRFYLRRL